MSEGDNNPTSDKLPAQAIKPESPTTARPLDFDDEPQEVGIIATTAPTKTPRDNNTEPAPPKPPPRPLSPRQEAQNTLIEAFPSIDVAVIRAVLMAGNWDVERAFHALLCMTDPNAEQDMPPAKPSRRAHTAAYMSRNQLESDELYARRLANNFDHGDFSPRRNWEGEHEGYRRSMNSEERDYNFFEDDFPVIRDNIRKGFFETQSKVNSWVQNLRKRIDGEDADDVQGGRGYNEPQSYSRPRNSGDMNRRSGDREHYDADPQVLDDDFATLELRDTDVAPPQPPRPTANLIPYKLSSPDERQVASHEEPSTEASDDQTAQPTAAHAPSAGGKPSKWQPLTTIDPSPLAENDPFSLGDSDDEKDSKPKDQNAIAEDGHLNEATTETATGEIGADSKDSKKAYESEK